MDSSRETTRRKKPRAKNGNGEEQSRRIKSTRSLGWRSVVGWWNWESTRMKRKVKWSKKLRLVAREKFARLRTTTSGSNCERSYPRDKRNPIQLRKRISSLHVLCQTERTRIDKGSIVQYNYTFFRVPRDSTRHSVDLISLYKLKYHFQDPRFFYAVSYVYFWYGFLFACP